jgi:hypothetical protein
MRGSKSKNDSDGTGVFHSPAAATTVEILIISISS